MPDSFLAQSLSSMPGAVATPEPPAARARRSRRLLWLGSAISVLAVSWLTLFVGAARHHQHPSPDESMPVALPTAPPESEESEAIPVHTVLPHRKVLLRTLEQPGTIRPWAQAELYAKTSGYLKGIQRETTPQLATEWVLQLGTALPAALAGTPLAAAAACAAGLHCAWWQAPQKDIGSPVRAGELLLVIDVPELLQDVAEKESIWRQREAELESARTAIATFDAAILTAEGQKKQAEADKGRFAADYAYHTKRLSRLNDLVKDRTISAENLDEQDRQVSAALAALESSKARIQVAHAELAAVSSKLLTAQADLHVKEAQVRVAKEELQRSRIMAHYVVIHSPFDGVVAFRGVDEGDFIQNASTGPSRLLMTVTSIDKVRVVLQVPEREALWVHVGTEAKVRLDARGDWQAAGRVARMDYSLDNQSRTMRVEIDLDNRNRKLLPGMYGQVTLILQKIENAYAIPATAVYSRAGENYIFLVRDGKALRQRVHIRYDDGHQLEVVKIVGDQDVPLDGSEEVIVSNKGELREEQRVTTSRLPVD